MASRVIAVLILLLPFGSHSFAQAFHQVVLGDTTVGVAEDYVVPQDEVWLLTEIGVDCFIKLSSGSGGSVFIARKILDDDSSSVSVFFEPMVAENFKEEVEFFTFFTTLPLFLPPSALMTYETGPNQRIAFRITRPVR